MVLTHRLMVAGSALVTRRISLTDLDNLPDPDDLAREMIKNMAAGLERFRAVRNSLER
ncbi:MAG: hypothetical protein Q9M26_06420 [Mariprofundales bacterium]|nr:hypothetical protein [Mariprofundales bacterium]